MKLNPDFVTYDMAGEQTLVPTGAAAETFHGIIRCNETAAFIIECLKEETSFDEIVEKMLAEYDADRERIAATVEDTLAKLRTVNAIIE